MKNGEIAKRSGFVALPNLVLNRDGTTGSLPRAQTMAALEDRVLVLSSGTAYGYGPELQAWSDKSYVSRADVNHVPVVQNTADLTQLASTTVRGITFVAWVDSDRGLRLSAVGLTSSVRYLTDVLVSPSGVLPKLSNWGGSGQLYWLEYGVNSSAVRYMRLDPGVLTGTLPPAQTFALNAAGHDEPNLKFVDLDIAPASGSRGWVVYLSGSKAGGLTQRSTVSVLTLVDFSGSLAQDPFVQSGSLAGNLPSNAFLRGVAIGADPASGSAVLVQYVSTSSSLAPADFFSSWKYNPNGAQVWSDRLLVGYSGTFLDLDSQFKPGENVGRAVSVRGLTVSPRTDGSSLTDVLIGEVPVDYGGGGVSKAWTTASLPMFATTAWAVLDATGSVRNDPHHYLTRGLVPASRPFRFDGSTYVGMSYESPADSSYYLMREDGRIAARFDWGTGGGHPVSGALPSIEQVGPNRFLWPVSERTQLISVGGNVYSPRSVALATINFDGDSTRGADQVGPVVMQGGGLLASYDGNTFTEHTFHRRPELIERNTIPAGTHPGTNAGTYRWVATYEWYDESHQLHMSAPSIPISAVPGAGGAGLLSALNVLQTERSGSRASPSIVYWRTVADDASPTPIYYRVNPTGSVLSSVVRSTSSFLDDYADADIVGNAQLYTVGGVLENHPPPAATVVRSGMNRIFLAGLEDDGLTVAFSKRLFPGEAAGFNDAFRYRLDPQGGAIVDLAVTEDRVIVFKRSAVFSFGGFGPDDTGRGEEFTPATLLSSDVGCSDRNATVVTPVGVMFESDKGIFLVPKGGGGPEYVGAPVEDYNSLTITSGESLPGKNQVRFLTREGTTLVYDTFFKQWSVHTGQAGPSAVSRRDSTYLYLAQDGTVYQESGSYYRQGPKTVSGSAGSYSQVVETGWIRPSESVSNAHLVWKAFVGGTYRGPHRLRVSAAYDYDDAYVQSAIYDPQADGLIVGDLLQVELRTMKKRIQAVKLKIEDLPLAQPTFIFPDVDVVTFSPTTPNSGGYVSVTLATTGPLPPCTSSGSGVTHTLTAVDNGVLTIDGVTAAFGNSVLVKDQNSMLEGGMPGGTTTIDNGLYAVTTAGAFAAKFVLTRIQPVVGGSAKITNGTVYRALSGVVNSGSPRFVVSTPDVLDDSFTLNEVTLYVGVDAVGPRGQPSRRIGQ